VDVAGLEHRPGLILPVLGSEPTLDSLLAVPQDLRICSIHLKCLFFGVDVCLTLTFQPKLTGISSFLFKARAEIALVEGLVLKQAHFVAQLAGSHIFQEVG
jgi:hypothetical protein